MLTLGDKGPEQPVGGIVCEKYCYLNGQRLNLLWEKLGTLFALHPAVPYSVMTAIAISFWFISQPWRLWKKISSVITFSKRRGHWNFNHLNNSNYFFFVQCHLSQCCSSRKVIWHPETCPDCTPSSRNHHMTMRCGQPDKFAVSVEQLKIKIDWSIRTHYSMSGNSRRGRWQWPSRDVRYATSTSTLDTLNRNTRE